MKRQKLIPLVCIAIVSLALSGILVAQWITFNLSAYNTDHTKSEGFDVVSATSDYVTSSLNVEGVGSNGDLIKGKTYKLTLSISHTNEGKYLHDDYLLTITSPTTTDTLMAGYLLNLLDSETFTEIVNWSPDETGYHLFSLSVKNPIYSNQPQGAPVVFTADKVYADLSGVVVGIVEPHTYVFSNGGQYELSATAQFMANFTISGTPATATYDFQYRKIGETTYTTIFNNRAIPGYPGNGEYQDSFTFSAPDIPGTYEVLLVIHTD